MLIRSRVYAAGKGPETRDALFRARPESDKPRVRYLRADVVAIPR